MKEYKCPHCGSDNIQKCEIIYRNGTITHSSTTTLGKYESTTEGQASTELAQSVAPPTEQSTSWIAVCVFLFLAYLFFKDSFIAFLVLGGIALLLIKSSVDADTYNKEVFPKEYARWQHSYICYRCGNRFIIK